MTKVRWIILGVCAFLVLLVIGLVVGGRESTDYSAPVISNVSVSDVTESSARITWTTDEPATSQVEYGVSLWNGSVTPLDERLVTSHSVILTGLGEGTEYSFRVLSKDASGNVRRSLSSSFTTEEMDFALQEVTETSVRGAIEDLSGLGVELRGNISRVDVIGGVVHVYYKPTVWDEHDAMVTAVHTAIKTMETLFVNPRVSEVVMWQQGDFTDKYGNTETELVIRIVMGKETADKIVDWKWVDDRAWVDYTTFFELAELQYVHPAIAKAL